MSSWRVVFLGNSLFLEDKIGLVVGEILRRELEKRCLEVEVTERSGVSLLDILLDSEAVVIVDSVYVEREELYGEVFEIDLSGLERGSLVYPHDLGLRDMIEIAGLYGVLRPEKTLLIGIGVRDLTTLSEDLSDHLKKRLDYIAQRILEIIDERVSREPCGYFREDSSSRESPETTEKTSSVSS